MNDIDTNRPSTPEDAVAQEPKNGSRGPTFWRSLEELSETPQFTEMLEREFPRHAAEWSGLDRRRFLQLSGASLGMAGLAACTKQPPEKVVPYVRQPEDIVPGKPLFFATAVDHGGYAAPVLAESHMGRPTKLEGNPEHPASRGGTDAGTQAAVLDLYDPDRSQAILHIERIRTWNAFYEQARQLRIALLPLEGDGLRILTGAVTSPTIARLVEELLAEMPKARWHRHEPAGAYEQARKATEALAGATRDVRYDFTQADVVVAVDSDFLHSGPAAVTYAKDFASRRKTQTAAEAASMSRLYSIESVPTATSTVADHRLALAPSGIAGFLGALASRLGVAGASGDVGTQERNTAWLEELAGDLEAHRGRVAVVAGDQADPHLHALALKINESLGSIGTVVHVSEPVEALPADGAGLAELVADIGAGSVSTLVVLDSNPVYTSTGDLDLAAALDQVPLRIHVGSHLDETGERCHWHLPLSHALESWGDLRAADGTATIVQPIVERLYDSVTVPQVLAALLGRDEEPLAIVQATWMGEGGAVADEKAWRRTLHDGWVDEGSGAAAQSATGADLGGALPDAPPAGDFELIFRPDPHLHDGRYANNGWLQETPKPVTKLTWDNALFVSPRTAKDRGWGELLNEGEQRPRSPMVRVTVGDSSVDVPVWVVPGIADSTGLLHLGYGRTRGGHVADGSGFDVGPLRTQDSPWAAIDPGFARTGARYDLACTQDHHSMEGRAPVQMTNVAEYQEHPDDPLNIHHHVDVNASMMSGEGLLTGEYQWGMSIDLTSCTSCNACLVACNAENNIPVIGKDQVIRGREMHWIRLDRYFANHDEGYDPNDVDLVAGQPVTCMQCEQAPCEVVCPVAATVHSDEGLNDMVYNRCVGTRYCSNNCPYKVRRFNFLLYQDFDTPQLKLGRNPDVSVRSRGVMEKCTYCVQRINQARIEARRKGEKIPRDGVTVACQEVCPSNCIVFGDISDADSEVSRVKASPLTYKVLEELGTRPRTTYLGRVLNPNPKLWARLHPDRELVPARQHHGGHGSGHGGGHGSGHSGHGAAGHGHGAGHSGHSDQESDADAGH
ncbi:MAG: TAT-variant-translocated molybdopterin oxidoreductase [Thermoanaerobaculia bacterium]|nr:TAT-variant-translocated molybdopterin oxidoreductase [Thermoanaerobaculia bacterium]